MLLEYGATVNDYKQMGEVLHYCGRNSVENKIILSLLMHNSKEPHEEAERLIKQIEKIEGLIYQSKAVEMLRVYVDRLQSLKNKYEKAKDSSQAVLKIILY
ncbi:MAG: hypothetical protein AB8U88_00265 [Rickettsia conorii subsp. raoultii]|uniref:Ankyrin repeat protein n=1 Tax=Rickettsia conorii subsp. raoultii TaxID=369822 RepID=A0ABY4U5M6_RICCR|nr:hypothetical protein [Rickettsia conorii]URW77833.1 hypothetical protein NBT09_00135 [Rickettsia conorii subsp. raoultii]